MDGMDFSDDARVQLLIELFTTEVFTLDQVREWARRLELGNRTEHSLMQWCVGVLFNVLHADFAT
jgi:hypothetical protein